MRPHRELPSPGATGLDDILITEVLSRRAPRPPDYEAKNRALVQLAQAMVAPPQNILQMLAEAALDLCNAQTAGISLLEVSDSGEQIFCWRALADVNRSQLGGTTLCGFSPCGTVLDRLEPLLFSNPARHFPYLRENFSSINYTYLIVGGGMTADAAVDGIREVDPSGSRSRTGKGWSTTRGTAACGGAIVERLGAGGRGPEPDRRARPGPAGGAQRATAGPGSGSDRLASPARNGLGYSLKPAPPFRLDLAVWVLRRRPENLIDRWDGRCYRRALALEGGPVEVAVTQTGPPETPRLLVAVEGEWAGPGTRSAVTAALERLLGLRIGLTEFEQFAAHDLRLGPLSRRFRGMKPTRFPTVFECLVNAIACQQVSLTLGIRLLGRLAEALGLVASGGEAPARAFPRPEDLAGRTPEELRPLGFSRQKARAIIELAGAVAEGRLDLEALAAEPDEVVLDRLCRLRGVGRWTAEYVLLRGLGRLHVFPGDDVGARNNLRRWLDTTEPLDYEGVHRALATWRPYAGLIYFHLLLDRLAEAGMISAGDQTRP